MGIETQRSNPGHAQMGTFFGSRANFPRKILKENMGNNRCHAKFPKKIETFIEICERKRK